MLHDFVAGRRAARVLLGRSLVLASAASLAACSSGGGGGGQSGSPAPSASTPTPSPTSTPTPTSSAATVSYLYSFGGAVPEAGGQPATPPMQASDGNFYGVAQAGGGTCRFVGCGVVYKMTPAGVATGLHSFTSSTSDGDWPGAALIQGNDGALYGTTAYGGAYGMGTVYRVTLDGTFSVIYSFGATPTDGAVPVGSLIQASDGNFYGTTSSGGANHCVNIPTSGGNCGTVFKVTPGGVETVLYSFGAFVSDGVEPTGSLVEGSDGSFYGMTLDGGANACSISGGTHNCGTAFKVTPAGVATILHSFGEGFNDGMAPQGSLILGRDGMFYGTTVSGGGGTCGGFFGCGTVFRMTAAGAITILHAFAVNTVNDGYGPGAFIIQGRDGALYGTTGSGGAMLGNTGTVFRVTTAGVKTIVYSFGPLNTYPTHPLGGVIQGRDGAFYGILTDSGDYDGFVANGFYSQHSGAVFKVTMP